MKPLPHARRQDRRERVFVIRDLADYMATEVEILEADIELVQAAERFRASHSRRFPIKQDGRLVGQISRADVLRGIPTSWR